MNLSKYTTLHIGLILFLVGISQISCGKKDCLNSAGSQTKEIRELETFKKIEIYNVFNVYLKSDTINQVEIDAGENLIRNIETNVDSGLLVVKDLNACGFIKGYAPKNLYISVDTLTEVIIHDGVNLYSIDTLKMQNLNIRFESQIGHCDLAIDCQSFRLAVWFASGNYIVKGNARNLYLDAFELSFIYANDVVSDYCHVYSKSMGDCYVKTNGRLNVQIIDSGNIYYSGSPSEITIEEQTGTGKLIKKE